MALALSNQQPTVYTVVVHGDPAPQGSKRPYRNKRTGHISLAEQSTKVKPWREAIKWAVIEARNRGKAEFLPGPIGIEITFTRKKPTGAPKRRRTFPDRTPDLDKLARSSFDALTQVGAIEDDARIVECTMRKVFPGEHPDALASPGAVIRYWSLL